MLYHDFVIYCCIFEFFNKYKKEQQKNPEIKLLRAWWNEKEAPDEDLVREWSNWSELLVESGTLKRNHFDGKKILRRIIFPLECSWGLTQEFHRSVANGHMGMASKKKT